MENDTDVIALCEHWLWPFDLPKLEQLHPGYTGFGKSDKRLSDEATLSRGCGGVGLIWKKSIAAIPVNTDSDRICGMQLELKECTLTVLCVYLPSSDHTFEEFTTYVNELDCTYQTQGPVVIAGDINAHLPNICSTQNPQGNLIHDLIDRNHLYPVLSSNTSRKLNYTYYISGSCRSHIFVDAAMVSNVISCEIMDHLPLNLSDHAPSSVYLDKNYRTEAFSVSFT